MLCDDVVGAVFYEHLEAKHGVLHGHFPIGPALEVKMLDLTDTLTRAGIEHLDEALMNVFLVITASLIKL